MSLYVLEDSLSIYYFSLKQVNNGKCITTVRGGLGYIPGLVHFFLFTTILIYTKTNF